MSSNAKVNLTIRGIKFHNVPVSAWGGGEYLNGYASAVAKISKQWIQEKLPNAKVSARKDSLDYCRIEVEVNNEIEKQAVEQLFREIEEEFETSDDHYGRTPKRAKIFDSDKGQKVRIGIRFVSGSVTVNPDVPASKPSSKPSSGGGGRRSFGKRPNAEEEGRALCAGWFLIEKDIPSRNTKVFNITPKKGLKTDKDWMTLKSEMAKLGAKWNPISYAFQKWGSISQEEIDRFCAVLKEYYPDQQTEPTPAEPQKPSSEEEKAELFALIDNFSFKFGNQIPSFTYDARVKIEMVTQATNSSVFRAANLIFEQTYQDQWNFVFNTPLTNLSSQFNEIKNKIIDFYKSDEDSIPRRFWDEYEGRYDSKHGFDKRITWGKKFSFKDITINWSEGFGVKDKKFDNWREVSDYVNENSFEIPTYGYNKTKITWIQNGETLSDRFDVSYRESNPNIYPDFRFESQVSAFVYEIIDKRFEIPKDDLVEWQELIAEFKYEMSPLEKQNALRFIIRQALLSRGGSSYKSYDNVVNEFKTIDSINPENGFYEEIKARYDIPALRDVPNLTDELPDWPASGEEPAPKPPDTSEHNTQPPSEEPSFQDGPTVPKPAPKGNDKKAILQKNIASLEMMLSLASDEAQIEKLNKLIQAYNTLLELQ